MNDAITQPKLTEPAAHRRLNGVLFWSGAVMLGVLLAVLVAHLVGACLDFRSGILFPYQLDYGEGIVWQQAALIPGPRMYSPDRGLPFIVFEYPPLFHLAARAAAAFMPDMLAGGRLVSAVATIAVGALVAGLVATAAPPLAGRFDGRRLAIAAVAGLLAICLHTVRTWGLLMRVDLLAVALGLAGVLIAARADGRLRGTTLGLLLCLAAVFTKQSELPAGIAVVLIGMMRHARPTLIAAGLTLAVGLAGVAIMQGLTAGGFLLHILALNITPFIKWHGWTVARTTFAADWTALPLPLAAVAVLVRFAWTARHGRRGSYLANLFDARALDRAGALRAILLVEYALASLMLFSIFKSGSDDNYFIEWFCLGCVFLGVTMADLARNWFLPVAALALLALEARQPLRELPDAFPPDYLAREAALVRRVAGADRPVGSSDMVLLMRAGKPVIYEPAIATDLAATGAWDETPLVDMIRRGGFAFIVTADETVGGSPHRSPAVDAAMRAAYPVVERVGRQLWLNLPR